MEIQIKNICFLIRFIQPFLRYFENNVHSRYEGTPGGLPFLALARTVGDPLFLSFVDQRM